MQCISIESACIHDISNVRELRIKWPTGASTANDTYTSADIGSQPVSYVHLFWGQLQFEVAKRSQEMNAMRHTRIYKICASASSYT